jgi:hypothetical protein
MRKKSKPVSVSRFTSETVNISELKAHPRNYKSHPKDQLAHIISSLEEHGFYRNVVATTDGTILAGHGVVEACKVIGLDTVEVVYLPIEPDSQEALKVLTGDNLIGDFGEINDRQLTEILRELKLEDNLLGTGFDEQMLANLVMVTRPESEIANIDEASEWVGMPEFEVEPDRIRLIVAFDSEEGRDELIKELQLIIHKKTQKVWSTWWPARSQEDIGAVRFMPEATEEA